MRIETVNNFQDEAVKAVRINNYFGTVIAPTGSGKSWVALKFLKLLFDKNLINKKDKIFIWAESRARENNFKKEGIKFKESFGINPLTYLKVSFKLYQGKKNYNEKRKVDIYDEIDFALTPVYLGAMNNKVPYKLGLTATLNKNASVYAEELGMLKDTIRQSKLLTDQGKITKQITKGQLLSILCPIVYTLDKKEALEKKIIGDYKTYIIKHKLDDTIQYLPLFISVPTKVTEKVWWNARKKIIEDSTKPKEQRVIMVRQMTSFLHNLKSKFKIVKALKKHFPNENKIIFNEKIVPLKKVSYYVCDTDSHTKQFIQLMNEKQINEIATAKKLGRGITLPELTIGIFMAYGKSKINFEQKIGRLTRYKNGKCAKNFMIVTEGTFEESWIRQLNNKVGLNICEYIDQKRLFKN